MVTEIHTDGVIAVDDNTTKCIDLQISNSTSKQFFFCFLTSPSVPKSISEGRVAGPVAATYGIRHGTKGARTCERQMEERSREEFGQVMRQGHWSVEY
jgi:hypothetical protein